MLSAPELQQIEVRQLLSHKAFGLLAGWIQAHPSDDDWHTTLPRNFDTDVVDAVLGLVSSSHVPSPASFSPAASLPTGATGPWPLRFLRRLFAEAFKSNVRPTALAAVALALLSAVFFYLDRQHVLHPKTPSGVEIDVKQPLPLPTSQHYKDAVTAFAKGQWNAALDARNAAIIEQPDSASAWLLRGRIYRALAQPNRELADYEQALELSRHPTTLSQLAWVLETSAKAPSAAHAERSLALAREANVLGDFKIATVLDTLAAAHAAQGNFAKAKYWQKRATLVSDQEHAAELAAHLALFEQQRRVMETALSERGGKTALRERGKAQP